MTSLKWYTGQWAQGLAIIWRSRSIENHAFAPYIYLNDQHFRICENLFLFPRAIDSVKPEIFPYFANISKLFSLLLVSYISYTVENNSTLKLLANGVIYDYIGTYGSFVYISCHMSVNNSVAIT